MTKKLSRIVILFLILCMILSSQVICGDASTRIPSDVFLAQQKGDTCTLSSAAMLLRGRMYLSGNHKWNEITESAIASAAWDNNNGLIWNWSYNIDGNSMTVSHTFISGISVDALKSLLDKHPEGIVFYCGYLPHAVYLTDYEGDTFYCADPANGYNGSRIPLEASYLGVRGYGSQSDILNNATAYWYISSYSIKDTGALCNHENYTGCGICTSCNYVFDWESTFDSSTMGTYKVLKDFTPRTDMPYDAATKATVKLSAGDTVEVLGSYRNAYYEDTNHFWYKFRYNNGEIGYVYDTYLQFSGYAPMQVSCPNFSPADQSVLEKKAQPVSGLVESVYPLKAVHAHLDGSWIGTWRASDQSTTQVELRQTEINTNLAFETLPDGRHTLALFAEDIFHTDSVKFLEIVFYINTKETGCSHSYGSSVTTKPTCTETGVRTYTCGNCGDNYTERIAAAGHSWTDASCTTPKTCSACSSTEGSSLGHSWTDANCTTPKTCQACGSTEGSALGHDWIAAACDSPKTCDRCGDTEGSALGHQWEDSISDRYCPVCGQFESPASHSICSNHALTAVNGCPACAKDGSVHICENNFPDSYFRTYISETFDSDSDGYLSETELAQCKTISLYAYDIQIGNQIASVSGIEFFAELEWLQTPHSEKITALDISHNPNLIYLDCGECSLTSLNVSKNTKLRELQCHGNKLTALDLSNNTQLISLRCSNNSIPTLDLSQCDNLIITDENDLMQYCETQVRPIEEENHFVVDMVPVVGSQNIGNILEIVENDYATYDRDRGAVICTKYPFSIAYIYDVGIERDESTNMYVLVTLGDCVHEWVGDTCSKPQICRLCGNYNDTVLGHDWTQQIQNQEHIKEAAADCRSCNVYWYDCSRCSAISDTEYYTGTQTGSHVFTEKREDDAHWKSGDCQNNNQYFYDCAYCDEVGTETYTDETKGSHVISEAWCTGEEKHYHACTVTGCTFITDEADHIPGAAATENSDQTCTVCGYVITPALVHTHKTTVVPGYAASCTAAGRKTYYTCACGKWFSDAGAVSEIADKASVILPALGHDWKPATSTTPKTCQRAGCGATEGTAREPYQIISGANSSWRYLSGNLTVGSDGAFSEFVGVKLDGEWIDSKHYTAKEGSTYVTIKKSYLRTLEAGTYRLTLVFDHDVVSTDLTIATNFDWSNPFTGDSSGIVIWTAVLVGSFCILAYLAVRYMRRKK